MLAGLRNWPAILLLFLRKSPRVIRLTDGLRFKVRTPMEVWIVKETCLDDCYQVKRAGLQAGWNVVDIGAGVGDFAIYAAKLQPEVKVFAFEPTPGSHALLEENLHLNGVKNVWPFQMAIGAESGPMRLSTQAEATHSHTVTGSTGYEIEVRGLALDDLFQRMNIHTVHFLKIDCEGGEYDILLRARAETLAKIERIEMEYHDGYTAHNHTEIIAQLSQAGFQVRASPNPVHRYLGYISAVR